MQKTIKLALVLAVAGSWLAAPAFARPPHQHEPGSFELSPAPSAHRSESVVEGGVYLGRDPDPNVRLDLRRDSSIHEGND